MDEPIKLAAARGIAVTGDQSVDLSVTGRTTISLQQFKAVRDCVVGSRPSEPRTARWNPEDLFVMAEKTSGLPAV